MLKNLKVDLTKYADSEKAEVYARFFKTGPGEYGAGDKFIGVTVPQTRIVEIEAELTPNTDLIKTNLS